MKWNGDKYVSALEKQLGDNLERAAIHLTNAMKEKVNRAEPYQRYTGDKGIWYKGEEPSLPGEPPKKIRGDLQRSIAYEMSSDRKSVKVGSNLDYARYLELGTSKMEARPFIRSTLDEERDKINNILAGKG